ncbi:rna-directed dna polymerase from mobile element jockey-like [Willisornis vidua]|uniref:Rna-directed dna polymerase from mobile element jockey-like n=1 Tax=Willisornis vidua TaxID=1566151 RepID=A0ABQ9DT93_9PASS|nr:rna-directed dna polymerase from mobile element jockey-like [Willisornis vidua]
MQDVHNSQGIRHSQHGFVKDQSCLANLIFYDPMTCLGDEGKAVDVVYLDFRKDFKIISHRILMEKLAAHGLDYRLAEVSWSLALVPMGDFNFPDVCWIYSTAERKRSGRYLDCVADNFLAQLVNEPTRGGVLLDLLFVNKERLVGIMSVDGHVGHSDHKMLVFSVLGEVTKDVNKTSTLNFQRTDFGLLRTVIWKVLCKAAPKNK